MLYKSSLLQFQATLVSCVLAVWPVQSTYAAETSQSAVAATETLDIDGNGVVDALTDGLLVMRYTFGLRGQTLIQGVIGAGATRTTAVQIESYLASLTSSQPATLPVSCAVAAAPSSSSGAPLAPGTQVQLTASCGAGGQPINYSWNIGVNAASITVAPSSTRTYTVTPSNSFGSGATFGTTVYIGNNSVTAPSNCSISQSPNSTASPVFAGTTVTLAAICSGGSTPTSCSWSNGISSTACTVNVAAPSATTTFSVIASNTGGSAPSVSTSINVTAANGAQNFCTGIDEIDAIGWPAGQEKTVLSGFKDQRLALKLIVPMTFNPPLNINHLGFMRIVELQGSTVASRDVTVSRNSCDFQSGNYLFNGIGTGDTAPYVAFTVNNPDGYKAAGAQFNVNSGETIYFNVRNQINGVSSCSYPSCDISFDLASPNRY